MVQNFIYRLCIYAPTNKIKCGATGDYPHKKFSQTDMKSHLTEIFTNKKPDCCVGFNNLIISDYYFFFAHGFLATAFFATGFAATFLATTFLATGFAATFFAGAFLATGFAATFFATTFLATGFAATFFATTFLATGFAATFFAGAFFATGFAAGFFAATFFAAGFAAGFATGLAAAAFAAFLFELKNIISLLANRCRTNSFCS